MLGSEAIEASLLSRRARWFPRGIHSKGPLRGTAPAQTLDRHRRSRAGRIYGYRGLWLHPSTADPSWRYRKGSGQPDVIIHAAAVVGGIGANQRNPGRF